MNAKFASVTLPTQSSSRRLSSPSRDHRPAPGHDARQSRVPSILHVNPRRWPPNGHPNQSVSFKLTTTQASTIQACTHPERHTLSPGGPASNLASPADMTGFLYENGSCSSPGKTHPHRQRRKMTSQRLRMELVPVLERSRKG